jgi:hypothetical protein
MSVLRRFEVLSYVQRRDHAVRGRLLALQEAEHGAERRQAHAAVAQAGRAEPVLVEIEPRRRNVGNALVQAGDQQTAYPGVNHVPGSL